MNTMIGGGIGIFFVLMIMIPVSFVGAAVLLLFAKYIGKIENARYWNSFAIFWVASILIMILSFPILLNIMGIGIPIGTILIAIISSVSYIVSGKFVWKCEWMQSVKTMIPIIAFYVALALVSY